MRTRSYLRGEYDEREEINMKTGEDRDKRLTEPKGKRKEYERKVNYKRIKL